MLKYYFRRNTILIKNYKTKSKTVAKQYDYDVKYKEYYNMFKDLDLKQLEKQQFLEEMKINKNKLYTDNSNLALSFSIISIAISAFSLLVNNSDFLKPNVSDVFVLTSYWIFIFGSVISLFVFRIIQTKYISKNEDCYLKIKIIDKLLCVKDCDEKRNINND